MRYFGSDKSPSHCALPGASQSERRRASLTRAARTRMENQPVAHSLLALLCYPGLPQEDCDSLLLPGRGGGWGGVSMCPPACLGVRVRARVCGALGALVGSLYGEEGSPGRFLVQAVQRALRLKAGPLR